MVRNLLTAGLLLAAAVCVRSNAASAQGQSSPVATPVEAASPQSPIDFARDVKPILSASCVRCHARGKSRGGFSIETRETVVAGGDSGAAVVPGKSGESRLIALVDGTDPDEVMPQKGSRLKPEQIAVLRAWIDQGLPWSPGASFARSAPRNMEPRRPGLPSLAVSESHPVDRLLAPYLSKHGVTNRLVDDRRLARRLYFDVLGIPPPPDALRAFIADRRANKRERLVQRLLADRVGYAEHWVSFWNDALRNDYRGPGYIDGGRTQISSWLYRALVTNMPYDRFVAELVNPEPAAAGFTKGIVWRGVVNASQTPEMQAAQNVAQVFMGVNLKCASCHDSFINEWQLSDAYGLAGVYADGPLQMVECDRPLRETAPMKFIYANLGTIDGAAPRATRLVQLANVMTSSRNGRLSRTIVNRLWARFLGRGLVEPVDDMEQPAWHPDLLDWLAEDLVANGYDLKHTMARILTSDAYRMAAVDQPDAAAADFVFRGPGVRRLTAEQFADALSSVTGVWQAAPAGDFDFTVAAREPLPAPTARWIWAASGTDAPAATGTTNFRKTFPLRSRPSLAQAVVAFDKGFALHVNGKKVGDYRSSAAPRVISIESYLRAGSNVITIAASRPTAAPVADTSEPTPPPSALLVQVLARRSRAPAAPLTIVVGSDATWTVSHSPLTGDTIPASRRARWTPAAAATPPNGADALISRAVATAALFGRTRASLTVADPLMLALGRPTREQVITSRTSAATTLQSLELNNGGTLAQAIETGARRIMSEGTSSASSIIERVYRRALGRAPTAEESRMCMNLLGTTVRQEGVEDLLWAVTMLPEFQLIH